MDAGSTRKPITVPELGYPSQTVSLSVWLIPLGAEVVEGDRVVELFTGDAVVDLPAPATGVFVKKEVLEDDLVETGQILGWVQSGAC